MRFGISFATIIAVMGTAYAADEVEVRALAEGAKPPPAKVGDIAWLAGHYRGEGLGGQSEEVIAPAVNGQMMGMFRQTTADGSLRFYEFYLFVEREGSLELRIKHFNPDFTGWEEKDKYVSFPLVAVEENAVYFDGVTFDSPAPGKLRSAVIVDGQGKITFSYDRVSPPLESAH